MRAPSFECLALKISGVWPFSAGILDGCLQSDEMGRVLQTKPTAAGFTALLTALSVAEIYGDGVEAGV